MQPIATSPAPRRSGFTLLELLIVIAVISLLAALVLPVIGSTRKSGLETKVINQLRGIGMAMQAYANDNNNYFPAGYHNPENPPPGTPREKTFATDLAPYLNLTVHQLYKVATNPFVSPLAQVKVRDSSANTGTIPSTFSVHGVLCANTSKEDIRVRRNAVPRLSEIILMADGCQRTSTWAQATFLAPSEFARLGSNVNLDSFIPIGANTDDGSGGGQVRYRNRDKAAALMADGHTEMFQRGTIRYRNLVVDR